MAKDTTSCLKSFDSFIQNSMDHEDTLGAEFSDYLRQEKR